MAEDELKADIDIQQVTADNSFHENESTPVKDVSLSETEAAWGPTGEVIKNGIRQLVNTSLETFRIHIQEQVNKIQDKIALLEKRQIDSEAQLSEIDGTNKGILQSAIKVNTKLNDMDAFRLTLQEQSDKHKEFHDDFEDKVKLLYRLDRMQSEFEGELSKIDDRIQSRITAALGELPVSSQWRASSLAVSTSESVSAGDSESVSESRIAEEVRVLKEFITKAEDAIKTLAPRLVTACLRTNDSKLDAVVGRLATIADSDDAVVRMSSTQQVLRKEEVLKEKLQKLEGSFAAQGYDRKIATIDAKDPELIHKNLLERLEALECFRLKRVTSAAEGSHQ